MRSSDDFFDSVLSTDDPDRIRRVLLASNGMPDFPWKELAAIADHNFWKNTDNQAICEAWADISIEAYSRFDTEQFLNQPMRIRVKLIEQYGPKRSHHLRDPSFLEAWVPSENVFCVEKAVAESARIRAGKEIDLSVLRETRFMKNKIGVLGPLIGKGIFARDAELRRWQEAMALL